MVLSLQSTEILEITVTKTLIGVLNTLATSFSEITDNNKTREVVAPFVVRNFLGKPVSVYLENKEFKYFKFGEKVSEAGTVLELEHDQEIQLVLFRDRSKVFNNGFARYKSRLLGKKTYGMLENFV
jgi:hypothetical protein